MSSFSDTFTKNQEQEELLNYDDSASYYFGSTVLICILLPWTWSWIRYKVWGIAANVFPERTFKDSLLLRYCRNGPMEANLARIEIMERKERKKNKGLNTFKIGLLVFMWLCWFFCVFQLLNNSEMTTIKNFNPYDILDLPVGVSDEKEIKKAYRTQSLKYHPDKNPDDPHAAAKFIGVAKAHKALTDPAARANYEKYGNPDGPQTTKVGIGLPRFLLEKKNHLLILCIFFAVFLIFIPAMFIYHYQSQRDYSPNGVRVETLQFFGHFITENTRVKNCPELIAASAESRVQEMRTEDEKDMKAINVVDLGGKSKFDLPIVLRNKQLLLAHMQRVEMSVGLRAELDDFLRNCDRVMNSMIEIACVREWLTTAQALIEFKRCLVQALDSRSNSLLQIPHFNEESVKHCAKGSTPIKDLTQFLQREPANRRGVATMSEEELLDVNDFCRHMTQVTVELKAEVEGETCICRDDIATVHVKVIRDQLQEGEALGYVHAPFWPELKEEEWYLFLLEGGKPITYARVQNNKKQFTEKIQFQVGRKGKHSLSVLAMCDSYSGIDKTAKVEFESLDPDECERKIYVHPEDQKLDEHPTLFQQLLGDAGLGDEESEDEEEGEGGGSSAKKEEAGEKKKEEDSDSSSSSDSDSSDSDSDKDEKK